MDTKYEAFREHVALKYQIYNGLFLDLPFEHVRSRGVMLPVFASHSRERLEEGERPDDIVHAFFRDKMGVSEPEEIEDALFTFMQIVERQVVLFDALEDAAFDKVHDVEGAGSLKESLNRIRTRDAVDRYRQLLEDYRVRIVLTAHPTQFYPDEVLGIITDLGDAIGRDDLKQIYDLLLQMGKTRFKNKQKPSPLDEAKSLLWYLENIFYDTLPRIQQQMLEPVIDDKRELADHTPNVELGFWPGGDRDGNPFVTSDLTIEIGNLLRSSILRRYRRDFDRLLRRLTFPGINNRMDQIADKLRLTENPLVRVSEFEDEAGHYCEDVSEEAYQSAEEFLADLKDIQDRLYREHMGLFADRLEDLMTKVRMFGFHFASMDIRQDSRIHTGVVGDVMRALSSHAAPATDAKRVPGSGLDCSRYEEYDEEGRIALIESIAELFPLENDYIKEIPEGMSRDTVQSLRAARMIQESNGERGVHRYVISNTRSSADVLEVWLLAQTAHWIGGYLELDIVPLFETIEDLHNAPEVMTRLYNLPLYARHLERRGYTQTIMLGFSDGTKDGGYVTANWEIMRAKQRLTEVSREHGIRVIFFDGRGGPPARGGGNTHKFYRSLGRRVDSKEIQLTVQGQTISSKYGTHAAAEYNVEQLVSAGLENNLFPDEMAQLPEEDERFLDMFSAKCCEAYLELKNDPRFIPYLREMTPLTYYGQANIASRPTSRDNDSEINLDTLRAIPFVGAWSQMKQNIPGFFGFGSGLEYFIENGETQRLKELYRRSLFFRTLVENSMQSLSKTYYPLTAYMARDETFGAFWQSIAEEARRTAERLCQISEQPDLLGSDPTLRESIQLRENMILPVMTIQQYALLELRKLDRDDGAHHDRTALEKIVIKSLAAAVNASRNAV